MSSEKNKLFKKIKVNAYDSTMKFLEKSGKTTRQNNQEDAANHKLTHAYRRKSDFIVENLETKQSVPEQSIPKLSIPKQSETDYQMGFLKAQKALFSQSSSESFSSELRDAYQVANRTPKRSHKAVAQAVPQVKIGQINVLIDDHASVKTQKRIETAVSATSNPFGVRGV
jgi:hypothetical protein